MWWRDAKRNSPSLGREGDPFSERRASTRREERKRERERRRGRMKGQKARGKGRKREKERERETGREEKEKASLQGYIFVKRTRRSATKVVPSPSSCSRLHAVRGWKRKAEKARWILDAINLASAFVRVACVHPALRPCVRQSARVCVGVRKAHPRTLRSRVFNAFVAL